MRYYLSREPRDGVGYEVHAENCQLIPKEEDRIYLGSFGNCYEALIVAKEYYHESCGCTFCCLGDQDKVK